MHAFRALKFNDFMANFCCIFPYSVRSCTQYFRVKLLALYLDSRILCASVNVNLYALDGRKERASERAHAASAFYRLSHSVFLEFYDFEMIFCGRQKRNEHKYKRTKRKKN